MPAKVTSEIDSVSQNLFRLLRLVKQRNACTTAFFCNSADTVFHNFFALSFFVFSVMRIFCIFCIFCFLPLCHSWNAEELAIYDLVEEINRNFYDVFGISQDATLQEVKKAYRRLSLELHPDRNKEENAADQFRQIAGIYEILRNKDMREKYDFVLENGMPDWRSGIYYYRRYRKMGGVECSMIIAVISTTAHYLMLWGTYFEKYLVEKQRKNKSRKGAKKTMEEQDLMLQSALHEYKPTMLKTLPVVIVLSLFSLLSFLSSHVHEKMQETVSPTANQEDEVRPRRKPVVSFVREERVVQSAEITRVVAAMPEEFLKAAEDESEKPEGVWSADEMDELVRLTLKFPSGTSQRWHNIARALGRTVEDVTGAARRIKHLQAASDLSSKQSIKVPQTVTAEWSQEEQKLLERALVKYPKGTDERWERIAAELPNRTKAEIIERFKKLVELVKSKSSI